MQINVTVDDGLYNRLKRFSKKRGSSVQDITRSSLNSLCPEMQLVEVSKINPDGSVKLKKIKCNASISEIYREEATYWMGTIEVTKKDLEAFEKDGPMLATGTVSLFIKTSDGRGGLASVEGMTGSTNNAPQGGKILLHFSGSGTLS